MSGAKAFFDESLPMLVREIADQLGGEALEQGLVARDTSGRLHFVSSSPSISDEARAAIEDRLRRVLGGYVRQDRVISFRDEPGVETLIEESRTGAFPMRHDSLDFRLLDRRIVGSAWVDPPQEVVTQPPRIVFASLKGGVGRTTALAVTASDLARRNRNILVIDLDLEAPGLGDMLLDDERMPRFGTVDYLVENGLGGVPDQYLSDFVGTSALTTPGGGRSTCYRRLAGKRTIIRPTRSPSFRGRCWRMLAPRATSSP